MAKINEDGYLSDRWNKPIRFGQNNKNVTVNGDMNPFFLVKQEINLYKPKKNNLSIMERQGYVMREAVPVLALLREKSGIWLTAEEIAVEIMMDKYTVDYVLGYLTKHMDYAPLIKFQNKEIDGKYRKMVYFNY